MTNHPSSRLQKASMTCHWFAFAVIPVVFLFPSMLGKTSEVKAQWPTGDYSKFPHANPMHARLPCLLCHRREGTSTTPAMPGGNGHTPCIGCHSQQFASTDNPVCTICHTDVKSGALKPFPRLKSFRVSFDHAKHLSMGKVNCGSCHRPLRGGVGLSIPSGFSAHATCDRCHGLQAKFENRDISSCGTCHQPGGYSRTPMTAASFRMGFSHAKHGAGSLGCGDCHSVRGGLAQRRQVSVPEATNHHASGRSLSCQTCHNGTRAFGGDDFSVCKRCHTGTAWRL
jgi:hypothetical protein